MKGYVDNLFYSFKKGLISKEDFSGELAEIFAGMHNSNIKDKLYKWVLSKLN